MSSRYLAQFEGSSFLLRPETQYYIVVVIMVRKRDQMRSIANYSRPWHTPKMRFKADRLDNVLK